MSTALLIELKQETDRLYIAGSDLAAGDLRLKRLLPRFEALAGQAPVFGKLAEMISRLISDEPVDDGGPAWRLQELGLLLGSILATQSVAQPKETASPLPTGGLELSTSLTCRQLAPVEQALTESGGGRYEVVSEAFKQGYFSDLRLFPLAIQALGDPYPELADFVQEHIIPLYGEAAVPYLAGSFDPAGGKKEARKLQLLARLGARQELILAAAEEGSDEVRAAAVGCLGVRGGHTELLIGYTRDRKKPVREAAFQALAESRSADGAETVYEAFFGKDRELAAAALGRHPWPELNSRLAPLLRDELEQASAGKWSVEDKARTEAWGRIQSYLSALGDSREPCLDEAYAGVIRSSQAYQIPVWERLLDHAAFYTARVGTKESLELLFGLEERYESGLRFAFRAAAVQLAPKELFEHYGGTWAGKLKDAVTRKKSPKAGLVIRAVEEMVTHQEERAYRVPLSNGDVQEVTRMEIPSPDKIAARWDPRWLDWAIRQDADELVAAFARPDHKDCRKYLTDKLLGKSNRNIRHTAMLLQGLERSGEEPEAIGDLLLQTLERKDNQNYYSLDYYIVEQLLKLPPSYGDRLRKLQEAFRYESARQIEYVLKELAV